MLTSNSREASYNIAPGSIEAILNICSVTAVNIDYRLSGALQIIFHPITEQGIFAFAKLVW